MTARIPLTAVLGVLLLSGAAWAFPVEITAPLNQNGVAVGDLTTEANTGNTAANTQATAQSVTTGGAAGGFDASLGSMAFYAINESNFPTFFPGYKSPGGTSLPTIENIVKAVLANDQNAVNLSQQAVAALSGRQQFNLSNRNLLQAIQLDTEVQMTVVQLLATLISVEAARGGAELSIPAQDAARQVQANNLGQAP